MSHLISSAAATAVLAALTASCAPTAAPGAGAAAPQARQCFSTEQVRNFSEGETGRLYIRAARNEVFELNTSGGCLDLGIATSLVITADPPLAGSRVCTGEWARISVPGSSAPMTTCRAKVERVLTAEEVAALPSAHRP